MNRPNGGFWGLLNEADQTALRELGLHHTFEPGDVLCRELEQATHVFILFTGWVKVTKMTGGPHPAVVGLRHSGDIVGEFAGESDGFRTATVQACATVQALILPYAEFTRFLDGHPDADRAYWQIIVTRLRESETLPSRSASSGAQRLAALLIDLGERHGIPGEGGVVIVHPLSQDEIASCIGASRATVTRALANWRKRHLISTGWHRITIMNITRLRRIAHKDQ